MSKTEMVKSCTYTIMVKLIAEKKRVMKYPILF